METDEKKNIRPSSSDQDTPTKKMYQSLYNFNLDHSLFTIKINRMIAQLSQTSLMIASIWQYFLILCNYQDSDYWAQSITSSLKKKSSVNNENLDHSKDRLKVPSDSLSNEISCSHSKTYKKINK